MFKHLGTGGHAPSYIYFYFTAVIALFLYSFTQIDLGLTLIRYPFFYKIQQVFQYVGYFNRPLSTALFVAIVTFLSIFYLGLLRKTSQQELNRNHIWTMVIFTAVLLTFSYNAFSYDLFNYVFDAKIVTFYNQNPYFHKALDYVGDPMLGFMHWTHRTYPYGPAWLALTVPLSYIGMGFFLPTFFLFKILVSAAFVGSVYFIEKILSKISPANALLGMVFFAFNPLVIIEGLVSSHNDVVMMFFALAGFYYFYNKKYAAAGLLLLCSIAIKFATVFLIPVFIAIIVLKTKKKSIDWEKILAISALIMIPAIILSSIRTELQPWYILWILPFVAFVPRTKMLIVPAVVFSLSLLFLYVPYLYAGNWDPPYPTVRLYLMGASLLLSIALTFILRTAKRA